MENDELKVLHVDDAIDWRGGQQQAFYLFSEMQKRGYKTEMLCQPGSLLEERCRKNNLPLHTVRMRNELDFIAAWKIARYCKKHGFTVFHAHTAHALSLGIMVKMLNAPITLFASRRVDFSTRKTAMSVWKYNNRHLKKIICISNEIKNVLINDGINADKLTTIYDGIDLKKFHHFNRDETVCTQWGIPQNHFIVGTVAALVGHKDYPNFLEAAKIVKDSNKNISFIAVGGGKDEHKLRQLAAKLELGNRFIFTGFQKNVGPIFRCFDLFVAASNKEGLGTSVLDALALAIPVVSTDAGGLPEAVQHNYNGLVVPKKNYKALAAAILTIATQPDLHAKFSKFALPSVEKFAIHVMVDKTIELYLQ